MAIPRSTGRKRLLWAAALLLMIIPPLYSDVSSVKNPEVNQVRVIAERASIYIEPRRGSTRIDIVRKGDLLNLLQTKKVNEIWYYVSYSSSRYGTRVSGFVLDSSVELVGETIPAAPEEKKPQEKAAIPPPASPVTPVAPKAEEKEETKPEPPPAPTKLQPEELPETSEVLVFTELLRRRSYTFAGRAAPLEEVPWRVEAPAPVKETKIPIPVQPEKKKEAEPRKVVPPKRTPEKKEAKTQPPEKEPVKPQVVSPAGIPAQTKGPGRFAFGLGYGSSFGGAGACLQFSPGMGIVLHAGAGIFPTTLIYSETDWVKNETLWSVGIKYYLPFKLSLFFPYVDIQYGGLRVEAAQVITGIWDYDYVYSREQKALWGPSFLGGVEIRTGRFGICGALGISYVTTSWEYLANKVSLSFDTSLVVHF